MILFKTTIHLGFSLHIEVFKLKVTVFNFELTDSDLLILIRFSGEETVIFSPKFVDGAEN